MSNKIFDQMVEEETPSLQDSDVKSVSDLANELISLEDAIAEKEKELKSLKDEYRKVSEDELPNKLTELGMSEFKLADGTQVSVSQFYSARITEDNREACFNWLEQNGLADVIKNTVSANFGRGEDETASKLMDSLEEQGYSLQQKKWVEPMTLKALVREQVEKGNDLPLETFNVFIGQKVKVKK